MKTPVLFLVLFMISMVVFAQDLEKHLWKERLLLVFSMDKNSEKLQEQLSFLSNEKKILAERKVKIYSFTSELFRSNFDETWIVSDQLFKKYVGVSSGFQIVLIGLDGEVKLKQYKISSIKKLLKIIDGMPMRKRELRKNK